MSLEGAYTHLHEELYRFVEQIRDTLVEREEFRRRLKLPRKMIGRSFFITVLEDEDWKDVRVELSGIAERGFHYDIGYQPKYPMICQVVLHNTHGDFPLQPNQTAARVWSVGFQECFGVTGIGRNK